MKFSSKVKVSLPKQFLLELDYMPFISSVLSAIRAEPYDSLFAEIKNRFYAFSHACNKSLRQYQFSVRKRKNGNFVS
jgi:hypothetical protein